jgi:hypothetical protein
MFQAPKIVEDNAIHQIKPKDEIMGSRMRAPGEAESKALITFYTHFYFVHLPNN